MRTPTQEKAALDIALDTFIEICRIRLHEMVGWGKRGWDNKEWEKAIAFDLANDADDACFLDDRSHLHDIANRAMMLWWQERMKGKEVSP